MRAVIWLLAMAATAGAVFSINKVLRSRPNDTAASVILPAPSAPPPAGKREAARDPAKAVETAANAIAALTGAVGNDARSDAARQDDSKRDGTPSFDIARVEPSGDTVVAGRATAGATVELLRNGKVHDRAVADASGQFVMVPPRLPAGDSELTLRSRPAGDAAAGGTTVVSRQTVVVSVHPNLKDQPIVALMAPGQPSVVLSKPVAADAPSADSVVVETVEADTAGTKLYVTGHLAPGGLARLYVNDAYQSTATADAKGRVAFTAQAEGGGRDYQVRLDEVDRASGIIKSRAEVPFTAPQTAASRSAPAAAASGAGDITANAGNGGISGPASGTPVMREGRGGGQSMTVSRGDSLWRISRLAYGDGTRYTVIYDANHRQIRNPNRIYPGQIFIIPDKRR